MMLGWYHRPPGDDVCHNVRIVSRECKLPMSRKIRVLLLLLVVSVCVARAGDRVEIRDETGGKRYETFDWKEGTAARRPAAENRIVSAVEAALQSKGLIRVREDAELYVTTHVLVDRHGLDELDNAVDWEYWTGVSSVDAFDLRAGTLVVDLVDAAQNRRVWRGVGSATVKGSVEKSMKIIDKLVREILDEFATGTE